MLTERQRLILLAVIDDYITSAVPVGSRTISKKKSIGYSAATIRNEMADLEEMGFLEQPHTSAGRIPSQKGYRFYVDHLLTPQPWTENDIFQYESQSSIEFDDLEEIFRQTTSVISELTNYMTITLAPKMVEHRLKHLQVIPLTERYAVSIVVTNTGYVDQRRIVVPKNVTVGNIEQFVNILNHRLQGLRMSKLKTAVEKKLIEELKRYVDHIESMLDLFHQIIDQIGKEEERVYLSGTTRILDQPEFQDVEKVKSLLDLLEETEAISQLVESDSTGVQVRIGKENHIQSINHCSIISASYMIDGEPVGSIGVLGPTRMDYSKVIGLIDFLSKDLTSRLRKWAEGSFT